MDLHLNGLCLLCLLSPIAGIAQDAASEAGNADAAQPAEIEAMEPGVTSDDRAAEIEAMEPRVASDDLAEERESIDPAKPTAVLASDVTRSSGTDGVMDQLSLGRTEITGNQELPKVLYIVPWQKSDPGELMGKPVNTLLEEVLAPIDRSEFMRQVDYYDDLQLEDQE
jgi:hypothetical protein